MNYKIILLLIFKGKNIYTNTYIGDVSLVLVPVQNDPKKDSNMNILEGRGHCNHFQWKSAYKYAFDIFMRIVELNII